MTLTLSVVDSDARQSLTLAPRRDGRIHTRLLRLRRVGNSDPARWIEKGILTQNSHDALGFQNSSNSDLPPVGNRNSEHGDSEHPGSSAGGILIE